MSPTPAWGAVILAAGEGRRELRAGRFLTAL